MASDKGVTLGPKAIEQVEKTVREVARRLRNEQPHRSRWQQHQAGGGNTIWFDIDSVLCPGTDYVDEITLIVTPTWYTGGCSADIPGSNADGTVDVYDLCSYLTFLTAEDLVGSIGRATYHYPRTGTCEPRWIIDDLCGGPEC
jgi:hypothetical protein